MIVPDHLMKLINSGQLIKFYKSKEWRELRKLAMKRDNYECQHCKLEGKVTTRETINKHGRKTKMDVNHIKPVKLFPHLALSLSNTEYLCVYCHNIADGKDEMIKKEPKFVNEERW
ncbi:HNH endonuclease [Sporosarcina saromensis]|uniref:HNH endonuclease n=1 Tax=Sporosarcina saromensis TaxID=359365 RepID=A0ABU4G775_9BACL|nr:HNH endonuclease [Sporosarcina saromensis]MDW0112217.1 HNH endonuclease [Sporosarcina saromensis]